jgi:2-polyprenyl-3-methyl-5-hydroxy-6-metoxy-1,4-benzoquinol methylase
MKSIEKCNLCGSGRFIELFKVKTMNIGINVVRCSKCGLAFLDSSPSQEEIKTIYGNKYFSDLVKPEILDSRALASAGLLKRLKKYLPEKGRILDIGAATGAYLSAFKNQGWDVSGIEISDYARESAKIIFDITLYPNLESAAFSSNYFDFILMNHVIEHLPEYLKMLKEVNRILKPEGILYVGTPNFGSPSAAKLKSYWPSLKPGEHLTFFTPKTLKMVLDKAGFVIIKCDTMQPLITTPQFEKIFGTINSGIIVKISNFLFPNLKRKARNIIGWVYPGDEIEIIAAKNLNAKS